MKKSSELKKYRDQIMKNGIVHIVFNASGVQDIIHPFSVEGYELLSGDFIDFLEKYRVIVPEKNPVVLDITGSSFDEKEKELIDRTIWTHFCLNMADADSKAKSCIKRAMLYLFYTVLSSLLLFIVDRSSGEVLSNLAYLPFWFFGYRLLIYLLIDCVPIWKNRRWYRQLASMKLIFSGSGSASFDSLNSDEVAEEISEYEHEADSIIKHNAVVTDYLIEKGIISLGCRIQSVEDAVQAVHPREMEYLSFSLADYISQTEPFLSADRPITLEIEGPDFSEEEHNRIRNAIDNYFGMRIATEEKKSNDNKQKIFLFSVLVVISAVLLLIWGRQVDVAGHEFIIMLFWFFGDYLLEFILISQVGYKKERRVLENCKNMKITFRPDKN